MIDKFHCDFLFMFLGNGGKILLCKCKGTPRKIIVGSHFIRALKVNVWSLRFIFDNFK